MRGLLAGNTFKLSWEKISGSALETTGPSSASDLVVAVRETIASAAELVFEGEAVDGFRTISLEELGSKFLAAELEALLFSGDLASNTTANDFLRSSITSNKFATCTHVFGLFFCWRNLSTSIPCLSLTASSNFTRFPYHHDLNDAGSSSSTAAKSWASTKSLTTFSLCRNAKALATLRIVSISDIFTRAIFLSGRVIFLLQPDETTQSNKSEHANHAQPF